MNNKRLKYFPLDISLILLSASVIGYQIILMQILSIQQWYYMAFMVISIALLGFGTSGTLFTIYKRQLLKRFSYYYSVLLKLTSLSMAIIPILTSSDLIQFDTYLLLVDLTHILRFIITCLLFFIPFLLAATAIILVFTQHSERIGKLYFANMAGSGIGGILAIVLMWISPPHQLTAIIAFITWLGSLFYFESNKNIIKRGINYVIIPSILIGCYFFTPTIQSSEFKSGSKILNLPNANIDWETNSPYGLTQKISSPAIRYAPSLSLTNTKPIPGADIILVNGEVAGYTPVDSMNLFSCLNNTPSALAFKLNTANKTLIVQSGTGELIHLALNMHSKQVSAIEENPLLQNISKNNLPIKHRKHIRFANSSTRSFLKKDTTLYDIILFPTIGSYFGSTDLYAIQEQNFLTIEAFTDVWRHLSKDGILCISSWMDYPYKNPLRLTATLYQMLYLQEIKDPNQYIIAIKNWNLVTLFVKQGKFTQEDLIKIQLFCDSLLFDPILPTYNNTPNHYDFIHQTNDTLFYTYLSNVSNADIDNFCSNYPFKIKPTTDNKPYFSQYLKAKSFIQLLKNQDINHIPYFELGYLIVVISFILILILGILFILLPIKIFGHFSISKNTFIYFSTIGIGYMMVEMVFIHQFNIYFNNPVFSVTTIISTLLIFSGLGSYTSERIHNLKHWKTPLTIGLILSIHIILLPLIINSTLSFNSMFRFLICLGIIGFTGFLMGFPFPMAIHKLSNIRKNKIPSAWAVNGFFSVFAVPLAVILSIELGYKSLYITGIICYLIASISATKLQGN